MHMLFITYGLNMMIISNKQIAPFSELNGHIPRILAAFRITI